MKTAIKTIFKAICILLISPLIIIHLLSLTVSKTGSFVFIGQLLSLIPGTLGSYCRIAFHRFAMNHCSSNCVIGFLTLFSQIDTDIHDNVYIGPQCNIGSCSIGKDTLIASGVHIMSGNKQHNIDDIDTPIQQQGGQFNKIVIGEDCWIGNGSLVMANVGNKCIIGAGSVVNKAIPDYSIAVGNPAKVIKSRLPSPT